MPDEFLAKLTRRLRVWEQLSESASADPAERTIFKLCCNDLRGDLSVARTPDPRCPKCGFTMCELFDDQKFKTITVAVPNGKYQCYHCTPISVQQIAAHVDSLVREISERVWFVKIGVEGPGQLIEAFSEWHATGPVPTSDDRAKINALVHDAWTTLCRQCDIAARAVTERQ